MSGFIKARGEAEEASAEGGARDLLGMTKPTAWRGSLQECKLHWQLDQTVQNIECRQWENVHGYQSSKEKDLKKAARSCNATTVCGFG